VAVILVGEPPELLFIERPKKRSDRWSGHVAFPGGLAQPEDADLADTARREAREEVGVELGEPVGTLSDVVTARPGSYRPMRVTPVVFRLDERPELTPDAREVADAFFFPVDELRRARRRWMVRKIGVVPLPFPWIDVEGHCLWGLTLQMVDRLLRRGTL
jgi:8-oxo-dGTP pyrophosphatase MutT (NUDIX family)